MISVCSGSGHNSSVQIKADSVDAIVQTYIQVSKHRRLREVFRADFVELCVFLVADMFGCGDII